MVTISWMPPASNSLSVTTIMIFHFATSKYAPLVAGVFFMKWNGHIYKSNERWVCNSDLDRICKKICGINAANKYMGGPIGPSTYWFGHLGSTFLYNLHFGSANSVHARAANSQCGGAPSSYFLTGLNMNVDSCGRMSPQLIVAGDHYIHKVAHSLLMAGDHHSSVCP